MDCYNGEIKCAGTSHSTKKRQTFTAYQKQAILIHHAVQPRCLHQRKRYPISVQHRNSSGQGINMRATSTLAAIHEYAFNQWTWSLLVATSQSAPPETAIITLLCSMSTPPAYASQPRQKARPPSHLLLRTAPFSIPSTHNHLAAATKNAEYTSWLATTTISSPFIQQVHLTPDTWQAVVYRAPQSPV
jgi:hypothetical protein